MLRINIKSYIHDYNKINKTNYYSILQIPKQNIPGSGLQNIRYAPKSQDKDKLSFITVLKTIYGWLQQMKTNFKAFGGSQWGLIKSSFHASPLISVDSLFSKLKCQTTLATVPVKKRRNSQAINATLEKLEFEGGSISYVLKNKGKQLGHLDITRENDEVCINFMTNVLGHKKYRNIENILLQGMVEDCMKQGFVPNLNAVAVNVGENMGHNYSNRSLYKRMGMVSTKDDYLRISAKKVLDIVNKRKEKFGSIIG